MRITSSPLLVAPLALAIAAAASAQQFKNEWVTFAKDMTLLGPSATDISNPDVEVDFAWADLDQDGWTDLVVMRKEPATSTGKRPNILLMNESGVLVDRSAQLASDSDVPGDQGFLTPTNDRDVVIVDVDNDGLLDVVTATTLSDGAPKHVSHPRIYVNKGFDAAGNWLGLRFESGRTPQLFTKAGAAVAPRFCAVAAGDVTGDGFADLYFGDYDSGPGSGPANDLNDRLLINDGQGFFSDESFLRMTSEMLVSAFGMAVEVVDMNQDGVRDIVKDTALGSPTQVSISYNDKTNVGTFNLFDPFHANFAPYHTSVGDMNNDGRPDVVISDDGQDRYRYNLGVDPFGRAVFGAAKTFQFLAGGDDGFGSNNLAADLNGDGFQDVIICDVDVDIPGCSRRVHIYHNPGGAVGSEINLREERESSSSGWLGAVGLTTNDLTGGHDVAVFDVDKDGDNDMILGRCSGTFAWANQNVKKVCQKIVGFEGPGSLRLSVCGKDLASGNTADLLLKQAPPLAPTFIAASFVSNPTPILGGTVVTIPPVLVVALTTDQFGSVSIPGIKGGGGPVSLFVQAAVVDLTQPELFVISNALELEFLP